ncbi:MAG: zinc ribbon-containing protein [Chromatiales bacterium]
MTQENKNDPVERLVAAYETMLERVNKVTDRARPVLTDAIEHARETAVELGELTREEADKIATYVERDMKDAADFIVETGQDFRDWFKFDVQLIEDRLYEMFASVADQTSLELRNLAERAKRASRLHTGEVTGPGTLVCTACGGELHFKQAGHIPPCPKCQATEFKRAERK